MVLCSRRKRQSRAGGKEWQNSRWTSTICSVHQEKFLKRRREEKARSFHTRSQRPNGQSGSSKTKRSSTRSSTVAVSRFFRSPSPKQWRRSSVKKASWTEYFPAEWWGGISLEMLQVHREAGSQDFAWEETETQMQLFFRGLHLRSRLRTFRCWFKLRWTRASRAWLEISNQPSPKACHWWGREGLSTASLWMGVCLD